MKVIADKLSDKSEVIFLQILNDLNANDKQTVTEKTSGIVNVNFTN